MVGGVIVLGALALLVKEQRSSADIVVAAEH
jgi:hypothetical protein